MTHRIPELGVRIVAMPSDMNSHGAIFGGFILCQLDLCGTVIARKYQNDSGKEDILTVKVTDVLFKKPVYVGDILECWGTVTELGNTSLTIEIQANAIRRSNQSLVENVACGTFKFVNTIKGKPTPIKK